MKLRHNAAILAIFLCSVLASVHGQSPLWGKGQRMCSGYISDPKEQHLFIHQEDDHCPTEELSKRWEAEIGRSYCQLRKVMVVLNTDGNHEFHPMMVEAERCVGHCSSDGSSCRATNTKKRTVQVTRKDINENTKCGQVEVIDHKECDCIDA